MKKNTPWTQHALPSPPYRIQCVQDETRLHVFFFMGHTMYANIQDVRVDTHLKAIVFSNIIVQIMCLFGIVRAVTKIHNINPGYYWNPIFLSSPFWHILSQTHYRLTCAEKSWNAVLSELCSYPRQTLFNEFTNRVYHRWLFIFTFPHWERGSVTWTHCYHNVALCLPCKYVSSFIT